MFTKVDLLPHWYNYVFVHIKYAKQHKPIFFITLKKTPHFTCRVTG